MNKNEHALSVRRQKAIAVAAAATETAAERDRLRAEKAELLAVLDEIVRVVAYAVRTGGSASNVKLDRARAALAKAKGE